MTTFQSPPSMQVLERDGGLTLLLTGELDLYARTAIEPALLAAIDSTARVTVDLGAVTFCDSTGLGMLLGARRFAQRRGATLVIRAARGSVRRLFEIAGAEHLVVND